MKTITSLILVICLFSSKSFAQEPGIDSIGIWPINATKNDDVYAAVYVATTTPSKRVSVTHSISGNIVHIVGCYATLSLSATMNFFADTVLLGKFNDGKYLVDFKAYRNIDTNTCVGIIDSNKALDSFIIVAPENIAGLNSTLFSGINFPNPVRSKIRLPLSSGAPIEALIYDCMGKLIKKQSDTEIDVSELPQGMYYLQLRIHTEQRTYKFLKE